MGTSGTLNREPMRRPDRPARWDEFADADAWLDEIDAASTMADELLWSRYNGGRSLR